MADDTDDEKVTRANIVDLANTPEFKAKQQEAPSDDSYRVSSNKEAVDFFNKDHFTAYLKGQFKVVRENPDGTLEIMEKKGFIDGFTERRILITDEKGNAKSTPITEL